MGGKGDQEKLVLNPITGRQEWGNDVKKKKSQEGWEPARGKPGLECAVNFKKGEGI